jgi:BCD family chlorophyll transporter-like MFS transporter
MRDLVSTAAVEGRLGATLAGPSTGYAFVYSLEILLLLCTLVALGPLVRSDGKDQAPIGPRFGLREFPI